MTPLDKQHVYVVLDISGSMFGEPLQSMLNGVDGLVSALQSSAEVDVDNTIVSVIAFSTMANVVARALPLQDFGMPEISAGGCTNCARMMESLLREVDGGAGPGSADAKPPMVFFFMDGYPTDAPSSVENAIRDFRSRNWSAYASFAVAGGAEKHFLARLTSPRRVFDLTINPNFAAAIAPLAESVKGGK